MVFKMVMRVFVVFHLSLATLTYEKHKYMFLTGYLFFWGGESFSIGIQIAGELSSCASLTTHVEMHGVFRSDERRVGKECRSWWSPDH